MWKGALIGAVAAVFTMCGALAFAWIAAAFG